MNLVTELKTILYSKGADMVDFADLRCLVPHVRSDLPVGISIAVALGPHIISQIREGPTKEYFAEYGRVNNLLNMLGELAARFLTEKGHKALWFAATHAKKQSTYLRAGSGYDPRALSTRLPHKTVATRARLGWIGKCALLVTETYGSAIRLTTVLTDAVLPASEPMDEAHCGNCTICVTACPCHAPSGRNWQPGLERKALFDAFACEKAAQEVMKEKTGTEYPLCGICIATCPWTQKYIRRAVQKGA